METLAAAQSVTVNNQSKLSAALKKQSTKKITVKTSKKVTLKNDSYLIGDDFFDIDEQTKQISKTCETRQNNRE